jgi:hypothetical protein
MGRVIRRQRSQSNLNLPCPHIEANKSGLTGTPTLPDHWCQIESWSAMALSTLTWTTITDGAVRISAGLMGGLGVHGVSLLAPSDRLLGFNRTRHGAHGIRPRSCTSARRRGQYVG